MERKVVVITGGNTGIGKEAAVGLVQAGATVVITSRDRERGEKARAEIADRTGPERDVMKIHVMELDLASFASVRRFAGDFVERFDRLDVLINNAGLLLSQRSETEEGFETTFGVNHLGHFLLTSLLVERLKANDGGARVINLSSVAHKRARHGLDFDDLQSTRGYAAMPVYSRSKLANIYFTRELGHRLDGDGVTVNALHPGFVRSEFARSGDTGAFYSIGVRLASPFAISPGRGARTSIYLASSPEVDGVTGEYFYKCRPAPISKAARDDAAARRLWDVSEELVASASAH
jgi:NAD(P)-dependent dehydrogenase (short-subunit alcohol dehydrogenase family)